MLWFLSLKISSPTAIPLSVYKTPYIHIATLKCWPHWIVFSAGWHIQDFWYINIDLRFNKPQCITPKNNSCNQLDKKSWFGFLDVEKHSNIYVLLRYINSIQHINYIQIISYFWSPNLDFLTYTNTHLFLKCFSLQGFSEGPVYYRV